MVPHLGHAGPAGIVTAAVIGGELFVVVEVVVGGAVPGTQVINNKQHYDKYITESAFTHRRLFAKL